MNDLLVSIIIPTYNNADMIIEALDTVFNQTYANIEVIVVDDGSTDDTEKALLRYISSIQGEKKIIYHKQENSGAPSARNKGMEICKGAFVKFLDSDDGLFDEHVIAKQVDCIVSGENDIVFGNENFYFNTFTQENFIKKRGNLIDTTIPETFFANHPITSAFMIRKDKLQRFSWDLTLKSGQEFFLLFQFYLNKLKFGYHNDNVVNVRVHNSPHRISNQSKNKRAPNDLILLRRMSDELNNNPDAKKLFSNSMLKKFIPLAYSAYRSGAEQQASESLKFLRANYITKGTDFDSYLILNTDKLAHFMGYAMYKLFTAIKK